MEKKTKQIVRRLSGAVCWMLSCYLVVALLLGTVESVSAADMEIVVRRPYSATTGTNVSIPIILNNNPGVTTVGLSVGYDSDTLQYQGSTWNSSLSSNGNNMLLATDVGDSSPKQINVSAVLDGLYSESGETFVTLNFTVLKDFSQISNSILNASKRDISDKDFADVGATVIYDDINNNTSTETGTSETNTGTVVTETQTESQTTATESQTASTQDSESETDEDSESETDFETETEIVINDDSGDDSEDDTSGSNTSGKKKNNKSGTSSSGSGSSNGSSGSGSGRKGLDSTYKTGAVDAKVIFGGIALLFVAGAGGSMVFLRRIRL